MLLEQNFDSVSFEFHFFCEAFGNFENPENELKLAFRTIVGVIKAARGSEWEEFLRRLPIHTRENMRKQYGA